MQCKKTKQLPHLPTDWKHLAHQCKEDENMEQRRSSSASTRCRGIVWTPDHHFEFWEETKPRYRWRWDKTRHSGTKTQLRRHCLRKFHKFTHGLKQLFPKRSTVSNTSTASPWKVLLSLNKCYIGIFLGLKTKTIRQSWFCLIFLLKKGAFFSFWANSLLSQQGLCWVFCAHTHTSRHTTSHV